MAELLTADRIARYISKSRHKAHGVPDGSTGMVDCEAFMPRRDYPPGSGLEEYLSVNRVEAFSGSFYEQLVEITRELQRIRGFDKKLSRVGILKVQTVHDVAAFESKRLSVRLVNPDKDSSYAGIYGLDLQDTTIAQEFARRALLYRPRIQEEN